MTGLVAAPTRVGRAAAEPPPEAFTQVELVWIEKQTEHWVRFGRERREQILDRRRRILFFPPGAVFAVPGLGVAMFWLLQQIASQAISLFGIAVITAGLVKTHRSRIRRKNLAI